MADLCIICSKQLSDGDIVQVDRGLQTLIKASIERGDGKDAPMMNVSSIKVHVNCRIVSSITAFKRKRENEGATSSPPKSRVRTTFYFKKLCFICGLEADVVKEKKSKNVRDLISCVSTINFKDNILELPDKKGDDVLKTVKKRISFEIDLVAAEARYHQKCFRKLHNPGTGEKKSRPQNNIDAAMENVFSYIENHEDCQFTLSELKQTLTDYKPDDKTIKIKLEEKYSDRIVITAKIPGPTMYYFFPRPSL
uniref:Uncharacterized protein n=1 Tax=Sipha flava TaxID=143950 RepID=A0A2S2R4F9_9HEMI